MDSEVKSQAKIDEDLLTFDIPDDGLEPAAKRRASVHLGNIALTPGITVRGRTARSDKESQSVSTRCPNSRACSRAGIAPADIEQRCGRCKRAAHLRASGPFRKSLVSLLLILRANFCDELLYRPRQRCLFCPPTDRGSGPCQLQH
jgi:hypothetical protein